MNKKNLRSVDLNLLVMLDVLLEEKHITKAAMRLNISQSAMSKSLARLRDTFEDPLLDRTPGGYELTVRAARLAYPIKEILSGIDGIINSFNFDPKTTTRTFAISALDYAEVILSDQFMRLFQNEAPNSKIKFITRSTDSYENLLKGFSDVIISMKPKLVPDNIIVESLYMERLVCVVDKDHPLATKSISLDDFLEYPHCMLHTGTDEPVVDHALAAINKSRKIAKQSPNFAASITSLKGTNMIMSVPASSVRMAERLVDLVVHEMPFHVPESDLCLMWHKRNKDRPGHRWFREQLKHVFQNVQDD